MDPEENRSASNLLLLCRDHHVEVDDYPEIYPVEVLQRWKKGQLEECIAVAQAWTGLTDQEVDLILSSITSEEVRSDALLRLIRAVATLRLASLDARQGPAAVARAWKDTQDAMRRAPVGWDESGNSVYAALSPVRNNEFKLALEAALAAARDGLKPLVDSAKIELAAVRVSHPGVSLWCDWTASAVSNVLTASEEWRLNSSLQNDAQVAEAAAELDRAVTNLADAAAGKKDVEGPPEPEEAVEEMLVPMEDPMIVHRELLDKARPHSRVDSLAYDAELRSELSVAAILAATIPETFSNLAIGLQATAGLAASVAKNADTQEVLRLISGDKEIRPLCVATSMLAETYRQFINTERSHFATEAEKELIELFASQDWASSETWAGNLVNGRALFGPVAFLTSMEHVRETLGEALRRNPNIIELLVVSCATWRQQRRSDDPSQIDSVVRVYADLPEWFPLEVTVSELGKPGLNGLASRVEEPSNAGFSTLADQLLALRQARES
ncbi:hypothetical protein DAD99_15800 [Pseudarthrobacter sp. AB1]|nr:hypothetical protein [Pseudarthrobacter sp. AB1]